MLVLFIYITRLASNEIFSPSNKIHREVGRAKDLSAPRYLGEKLQKIWNSDYPTWLLSGFVFCVCVTVLFLLVCLTPTKPNIT
jgi:hypothetical protein